MIDSNTCSLSTTSDISNDFISYLFYNLTMCTPLRDNVCATTPLATVSLKVVSHKRRRKCTRKRYDRFINSSDLRLTIKSDCKVKSGGSTRKS